MTDDLMPLDGRTMVIIPTIWDVPSAAAAKAAGAQVALVSGSAVAATIGLPDLGLSTRGDLERVTTNITRAVGLPLMVDIDDGLGSFVRLGYLAEALLNAGAMGVMVEDAESPGTNRLCSADEMVSRILIIREATGGRLKILARTDVLGPDWLFDDTHARLSRYLECGADWIVAAALRSLEELQAVGRLGKGKAISMPEVGFPTIEQSAAAGCCGALVASHASLFPALLEIYRETIAGEVDQVLGRDSKWRDELPGMERFNRWLNPASR